MPYCNICKRYDHWPKEHGWYVIEKACNPSFQASPFSKGGEGDNNPNAQKRYRRKKRAEKRRVARQGVSLL
jgi:hypothetical protein